MGLLYSSVSVKFSRLIREAVTAGDEKQVQRIATILTDDFAVSQNPNSRKGGLIGLAATAIALGKVEPYSVIAYIIALNFVWLTAINIINIRNKLYKALL